MDKETVVAALEEIALLLDLSGENPFKTRSYTNAARSIEALEEDLAVLIAEDRLGTVKGVGAAIEQKIRELMAADRLEFLENLRAQFPDGVFDLLKIPGLGPKRVRTLYDELGIDSLPALGKACRDGRVVALKGFSKKLQDKILEGLDFRQEHEGLFRAGEALPAAEEFLDYLAAGGDVIRIEIAGSLRRCKEVVKDADLVASSASPAALMQRFVEAPGVATVVGHGETKSSVVLESGLGVDLRVVDDAQFPFALAHFTGSKVHNVVMRRRARDRGWKLNEYGLFDQAEAVLPCVDEQGLFARLELPYVPPELREDRGEFDVEAISRLVTQHDLRGAIHFHTAYSDGHNTLEEMAEAAQALGYEYMAVCDHSQSAGYAGGLPPAKVKKQHREIDSLNEAPQGIRILKGIESDIRVDGSLDYDEDVLRSFDLVIASVHSRLNMDEAEATARLVKAIEHPHAHIIGHLTGRLLLRREGYRVDMDRIVDACVANHTALEISAHPARLDVDWRYLRRARDKGVKFSLGTDAHRADGFAFARYGIGIARKGWLEAADLLNCMGAEELLAWRK